MRRADELHEACEVELAGLTTHSALNGQRGRCVQKLESEPERWRVKLDAGRVINAKLESISRVDVPTAEVPSRDARSKQCARTAGIEEPRRVAKPGRH